MKSVAIKYVLLAAVICASGSCVPEESPNIIFILTDDQGYGDLGAEFPEIIDKMSGAYEKWWTEVLPHIHRVAEDPRWSQDYNPQLK